MQAASEKSLLYTEQLSPAKAMLWAWLIVSLGAIYYCYEYFLRISPSVMTSELMRTYHLNGAQIGNLSAFYYHAYMPMQIMVGLLMDRFGPRRLLSFACLLCAVGSYLFACSENLTVAESGRFLVGFGSAFAFVGALKLATIWLPANRFALVSGIIMCLGMIGAMLGDILLQNLVDSMGWKVTVYLSAIAGVILTVILWNVVRDVNPENPHHDMHLIKFKVLLQGLWSAIKNPQIWFTGMVGFLLYMSLSAFAELWSIPYLQEAQGLTKSHAANVNSMIFLGWAIGSPLWGWLSDFFNRRCLPMMLSGIGALVSACIILYVPGLSLSNLYILYFLFGLLSGAQILVFAVAREASSIKIAATVIALTNMIVMIGGNIFQPAIGLLLDRNWSGVMVDGARVYSGSAYEYALSVLPICFAIAIVLTFFIRETYGEIKETH